MTATAPTTLGSVVLIVLLALGAAGCASPTKPTTRTEVEWDNYPAPIHAEIDHMEASQDCPGLLARYGISLDEGGGDDLLAYIDEALILADCPR